MTSTELRDALFTAILAQQNDALIAVCNQNVAEIVEHFGEWAIVPVAVRSDREALQRYGHCLMILAKLFEANGMPQLMERIAGGGDNIIVRWRNAYTQAKALADGGNYEESSRLLVELRARMEGAQGPVVDNYRPKILGLLGWNAFYRGRRDEAVEMTNLALADCRRIDDFTGIRAYTENLQVLAVAVTAESSDEGSVRLRRIRASLARAQDLSDDARFDQSNDLLEAALADIKSAEAGSGLEYHGKALGLLGLNFFRMGDMDAAREHTTNALAECQRRADIDGERIYSENLQRIDKELTPATPP
jgi:tetratricopeptide (TPR) repeat protein